MVGEFLVKKRRPSFEGRGSGQSEKAKGFSVYKGGLKRPRSARKAESQVYCFSCSGGCNSLFAEVPVAKRVMHIGSGNLSLF